MFFLFPPLSLLSLGRVLPEGPSRLPARKECSLLSVFCQGLFSEPIFCTWGVLSLFSEPTFCGCGPDLHFAIVHGSSEMASPMMDIQHTKRLLGYAPQDGTAFASRPGGPKL